MDKKHLDFLYVDQAKNENHIRVRNFVIPHEKEKREKFQEIYHLYINSAYNIDWNCSSCVITEIKRLYEYADQFKDQLTAKDVKLDSIPVDDEQPEVKTRTKKTE